MVFVKMKRLLLTSIIGCLFFGSAAAQTSRVTELQKANNFTITLTDGRVCHYLVSDNQTYKVHYGDQQIVIAGDAYDKADIRSMRFVSLPRFSLNEDSTAIGGNYAVNYGLMAFRRSFDVGKWNSIVVPFSLTGAHLREAFGDDAMLAKLKAVQEGDVATVEFETVDLGTSEVALEAGVHYLLRPTRQPDIAAGARTSVVYGSGYVLGPVYVIPNVSLEKGKTQPANQALHSNNDQVRVRMRGSYVNLENSPYTSSQLLFSMSDGLFAQAADGVAVKAFRSWLEQVRNTNNLTYRFYINGIDEDLTATTAIHEVLMEGGHAVGNVYDLSGRKVAKPSRGLFIQNGKKLFVK